MNAELKAKWLKALRSGKYRQGNGYLKRGDAFCCLGVLADIRGCKWVDSGGNGLAPFKAKKPVGKPNDDDGLLRPTFFGLSGARQTKLAEMNDDGKSFDEIADYIEKNVRAS